MKLIISIDGGGIRGAAAARFLQRLDERLNAEGTNLRKETSLIAGTSTGGIIALALATTDLEASEIVELYGPENAERIFTENSGLFEVDGVNSPKYEAFGKSAVLRRYLERTLVSAMIPVMVTTYDLVERRPFIIKSWNYEHKHFPVWLVADATSAAPTFFPTVLGDGKWLIDGGVVANNPTMCAYAEATRMFPGERIKVLSIGTGSLVRPINGYDSQEWGALQWATKGDLLGIVMDEGVVEYQAKTILGDDYMRVNSKLNKEECNGNPPNDDMDDVSPDNIANLKDLGDLWFDRFEDQAVNLILGE